MRSSLIGSFFIIAALVTSTGVAFAQTATQCPQGWTWNGSNCQVNQQSCQAAGGSWNNSSASCSFGSSATTATPSPAPSTPVPTTPSNSASFAAPGPQSCPLGWTWNGSNCQVNLQSCNAAGGAWNNSTAVCYFTPVNGIPQPSLPTSTGQVAPASNPVQNAAPVTPTNSIVTSSRTPAVFAHQIMVLARLTKRVSARGISMPSSCTSALSAAQALATSSANAASGAQGMQQTLSNCAQIANGLLTASSEVTAMKTALQQLGKQGVDVAPLQSQYTNTLLPAYAKVKSGSVSDTDIQTFFDTADDLRGQIEDALVQASIAIPSVFQFLDTQSYVVQPAPSLSQTQDSSSTLANIYSAFLRLFGMK